ncbi:hypothetical protein HUJ04_008218 [Dendroctonus ponderosae]|nr:hypothetical protein HUJ04_008218 [Dendroctonus ponderosae]
MVSLIQHTSWSHITCLTDNMPVKVNIGIFEKNRRKYRKLLDEGYYFIENNLMWKRNYLQPVHANNIDFRCPDKGKERLYLDNDKD